MKNKKRIFSFVLSLLLIIPAFFCLTACGGDDNKTEYAWGKTFTFQGTVLDDKNSWGNNSTNTKLDLMKLAYSNNNLNFVETTVNDTSKNISESKGNNVNEFLNNLDTIARQTLASKYKDITFVMGSEQELTLKIIKGNNEKTYSLVKTQLAFYNIVDESGTQIGYLNSELERNSNTDGNLFIIITSSAYFSDFMYYCKISVPTITPITDGSADLEYLEDGTVGESSISFFYTAYFNVKK